MSSPFQCSRCKKRLAQQVVRAAGMQFHTACFICDGCKKPLQRQFQQKRERLYHPDCYARMFGLMCQHCQKPISGQYVKADAGNYHKVCYDNHHALHCFLCDEAINGAYLQDLWGQKAHSQHGQVKTTACHVCARLLAPDHSKTLADGRALCNICQVTEVITPRQVLQAKMDVLKYLQEVGFDYIPDYVKVEMYAEQALINERMRASATGNIHGYTRTAQRHIPQYGLILEHSIHVLNGMPRLAFMGVLAHELLHVWLNERELKHLQPAHVEGFCNLATALIYEKAVSAEDRDLAKVLQQRMDEDPDSVYGDGYRLMKKELQTRGWPALLRDLQNPDFSAKATPESAPKAVLAPKLPPEIERPSPVRKASSPEESARKLAEIRARVQAKMQGAKTSKPEKNSKNSGNKKGLKKLRKRKR